MRITPPIARAVSSAVAIVAKIAVFAQSGSNDGSAPTRKRYLPEYTASGDLMQKNFNEWVYVGSPLTPNALNVPCPGARQTSRDSMSNWLYLIGSFCFVAGTLLDMMQR
jgi:hypothetical protein